MDEYSEIPRSDDGNDLERWKKKKASETGKEKKENRFLAFFNNKYAFAGLTCVLVLAIVLPVIFTQILPKTPTAQPGKEQAVPVDDGKDREEQTPPKEDDPSTEEPKEEDTHYGADMPLLAVEIDSIEAFNEKHNVHVRNVKTEEAFSVVYNEVKDRNSGVIVGFQINVYVWGEQVDEMFIQVALPGDGFSSMYSFEIRQQGLPNKVTIDGVEYSWYEAQREYGYLYTIMFVENDLRYYMEISMATQTALPEILSAVFK